MRGHQCEITVKTKTDQFRDQLGTEGKRYTVYQKDKWTNVLRDYGVDPKIHYLKNSDGKHCASILDRVDDFTKQFAQVRQHYVVYIHKMDKAHQLEQANLHNKAQQVVKTPTPVKKQNKRGKKRAARDEEMNGRQQYEEDGFVIPNTAQQFNGFNIDAAGTSANAFGNQNQIYDFENEDAMSQDSQDSQDEGPDIKAQIVNKLVKVISNGDMYRIRKELKQLKTGNRFIKASRYLPFSLNMLQNVFLE